MARSTQKAQQHRITPSPSDPKIQLETIKKQLKTIQEELDLVRARNTELETGQIYLANAYDALESEKQAIYKNIKNPTQSFTSEVLHRVGGHPRRVKIVLPDEIEHPRIFAAGDQQVGADTTDHARIAQDVNWVLTQPDCFQVLLGDCVDAATKISIADSFENIECPGKQLDRFVNLYRPVVHRTLGIVGGNHEERLDKVLGAEQTIRLIAEKLSVGLTTPIPYSGALLLLDVYWRQRLFTFTIAHGVGGAQTPGAVTQRTQKDMLTTDSQINLYGHLHKDDVTQRRFIGRSADGGLQIKQQRGARCGTYMKYMGSYAERRLMSPADCYMIVVNLLENGHFTIETKG